MCFGLFMLMLDNAVVNLDRRDVGLTMIRDTSPKAQLARQAADRGRTQPLVEQATASTQEVGP